MSIKGWDETAESKTARALPRIQEIQGKFHTSYNYLSPNGIRGMLRASTLPLGHEEDSFAHCYDLRLPVEEPKVPQWTAP